MVTLNAHPLGDSILKLSPFQYSLFQLPLSVNDLLHLELAQKEGLSKTGLDRFRPGNKMIYSLQAALQTKSWKLSRCYGNPVTRYLKT
jgi:hypothetical protein